MSDLKVFHVGEYGEVYAGKSEEEIRSFVVKQLGSEEAKESIAECFEEVADLDTPIAFKGEDGEDKSATWREIAAMHNLPDQISTQYN